MKISIHLSFDGDCAAAFDFYARVLGGHIDLCQTYGESTLAGDMAPELHDRILHARLCFGDQRILGSDAPPGWRTPPGGYAVAVEVPDPAEGARIFAELAEGGTIRFAYAPTSWARGFGLLADRHGVQWLVNCPMAA